MCAGVGCKCGHDSKLHDLTRTLRVGTVEVFIRFAAARTRGPYGAEKRNPDPAETQGLIMLLLVDELVGQQDADHRSCKCRISITYQRHALGPGVLGTMIHSWD